MDQTLMSQKYTRYLFFIGAWWRHQMETFSAFLAICAGNSPVPGEFRAQRPVTRSFDVSFDLRLNKRLRKQSWGWWFETLSRPLWRHCNENWVVSIETKENIKTLLPFVRGTTGRRWLLWEEPPVAGGFSSQRGSDAENVSIWWCHHEHFACGII